MRGSLFDAVGGDAGLLRLAAAHHARCLADPVVAHAFSSHGTDPRHVQRLAAYWAAVLGGPESDEGPAHASVLRLHAGSGADAELGSRFAQCFLLALDDAAVPGDPRLRACLADYIAWAVADVMALASSDPASVPSSVPAVHWDWDGLVPRAPLAVRAATAGDEAVLRSLRLEALDTDPQAFTSTPERERSRTTADWQRWFAPGVTFLCEVDGRPGGLVAVVLGEGGRAQLVGLWVRPAARGAGAGRDLVRAACAWAAARGLDLELDVHEANRAAQRLYERCGFLLEGPVPRTGTVRMVLPRDATGS